jgi:hypothetical protein
MLRLHLQKKHHPQHSSSGAVVFNRESEASQNESNYVGSELPKNRSGICVAPLPGSCTNSSYENTVHVKWEALSNLRPAILIRVVIFFSLSKANAHTLGLPSYTPQHFPFQIRHS